MIIKNTSSILFFAFCICSCVLPRSGEMEQEIWIGFGFCSVNWQKE